MNVCVNKAQNIKFWRNSATDKMWSTITKPNRVLYVTGKRQLYNITQNKNIPQEALQQ
jgi:hypothetical protein